MAMHKKMMAAGGNMKKKMMAAGGTMKKKMMSYGGASMKKKMMAAGGMPKMPMAKNPQTGKMQPTFTMDGVGKMAKGGMKKKMMRVGGISTSEYDVGSMKYPGGGRSSAAETKKSAAITPAMIKRAGITGGSARQRLNAYMNKFKMEGGKYVKRKRILKSNDPKVNAMVGLKKESSKPITRNKTRDRKSTMSQENPKLNFGTKTRSGTTVKPKKRKAGPMGFKKFFEAMSKRGGFRSD